MMDLQPLIIVLVGYKALIHVTRTWPNDDWVLETDNDGGIKIHVKKYNLDVPFTWRAEIDKSSEPWTGFETHATSAFWYTRQSWLYFKNIHYMDGMDDNKQRIRIHVEHPNVEGTKTFYNHGMTVDNLTFCFFGTNHLGDYHDIVSHEFTHGVIQHSSNLNGSDEPGALNESFADIFGLMAERMTVNGEVETNLNWEFGTAGTFQPRYLNNPNVGGRHLNPDCLSETIGQPDTYLGLFWTTFDCPGTYGDKHSKSGVQNFWFYLLSEGGSGLNDLEIPYSISGIGETKAARIAFWSMTNVLFSSSQYSDAREGAIAAAALYYGECSNEYIQTVNAWHAVGVGSLTDCSMASIHSSSEQIDFNVYPNPMHYSFAIAWHTQVQFDVTLYSSSGEILFEQEGVVNNQYLIPPYLANGTYILEVKQGETNLRKRIIKN
jgi:hypothetical protein